MFFLFPPAAAANTLKRMGVEENCWMAPVKERRKLERFQLHVPAKLELADSHEHRETLQLETRDVSAAGAYLIGAASLPEGTPVRVEIFLSTENLAKLVETSGGVRLKLRGRIIRSDDSGTAVRFERRYQIKTLHKRKS